MHHYSARCTGLHRYSGLTGRDGDSVVDDSEQVTRCEEAGMASRLRALSSPRHARVAQQRLQQVSIPLSLDAAGIGLIVLFLLFLFRFTCRCGCL